MDGRFPDNEEMERIRKISDHLLGDPVFRRSPVLARLLRYLIAKTAANEPIKSYSIAFDGLGRPDHDQADADTYARVAVARLRKFLAAYYATHKSVEEIYVDSGTYHVRLKGNLAERGVQAADKAPTAAGPVSSARAELLGKNFGTRHRGWLLSALIAVLVFAGALLTQSKTRGEAAGWTDASFPSLGVVSQDGGEQTAIPPAQLIAQKQELIAALGQYNGFLVTDNPSGTTDFSIRLTTASRSSVLSQTVTLTEKATGLVVWAETFPVHESAGLTEVVSSAVNTIGPPNGALMGYLRTKSYDVNTPIGCWLKFTEGVQTFNTSRDDKLRACAASWYDHAPNRRHAAFLFAWTLIDAAAINRNQAERAALLDQAFTILHRAITLHPDFALFYIAAMRGYALQGDRTMVVQSANDAMRTGGKNRLVVGMAASVLAYWNDPAGEKKLSDLARSGGEAFPWEHVGLFVAAMMRDDTSAAGQHMFEIEKFENGQPLLLIVKAAYASRMGQRKNANAALAKLRGNPVIRVIGISSVVERLPIAPEVALRLRQWLPKDI